MSIKPDELRKRLPPEVRAEIMRDNWISHDARWFLKVGTECGFETANKLNKAILKSMAKTEMRRLMNATGCGEIGDAEELVELVNIAFDVYFPPSMIDWVSKATGKDSIVGIVNRCYVHEEVKRAGVTGMYECACGHRLEGWLAACDLKGEVRIVKSLMREDPICEVLGTSICRLTDDRKSGD